MLSVRIAGQLPFIVPLRVLLLQWYWKRWPVSKIIPNFNPVIRPSQLVTHWNKVNQLFRSQVAVNDGSWEFKKPLEDWTRLVVQEDISRPRQFYKLENLQPNSYYELQVMARNDIDASAPNPQFIFRTADGEYALSYSDSITPTRGHSWRGAAHRRHLGTWEESLRKRAPPRRAGGSGGSLRLDYEDNSCNIDYWLFYISPCLYVVL